MKYNAIFQYRSKLYSGRVEKNVYMYKCTQTYTYIYSNTYYCIVVKLQNPLSQFF